MLADLGIDAWDPAGRYAMEVACSVAPISVIACTLDARSAGATVCGPAAGHLGQAARRPGSKPSSAIASDTHLGARALWDKHGMRHEATVQIAALVEWL